MCFLIEEQDGKSSSGSNFKQDMKRHVGLAELGDLCRRGLDCLWTPDV